MRLAGIKPGDTVTCNVRGRVFTATVRENLGGELLVDPPRNITYYRVPARQVTKHVRFKPTDAVFRGQR